MGKDITNLIKEYPNITLNVKAEDLKEMVDYCVEKKCKDLEKLVTDANTETYLSPEQTAKKLDVNKTTLWRWSKSGYLIPVEVGGKRRYKLSDIQKLLGN